MTKRAYDLVVEVSQRWPSLVETDPSVLMDIAKHTIVDNPQATADTLARIVRDQLSRDATWQNVPVWLSTPGG